MKQTSVEWLFAHLLPFLPFSDAKEREHFRKCLEEAKEMHKDEIIDAYDQGSNDILKNIFNINYYNETFNTIEK